MLEILNQNYMTEICVHLLLISFETLCFSLVLQVVSFLQT